MNRPTLAQPALRTALSPSPSRPLLRSLSPSRSHLAAPSTSHPAPPREAPLVVPPSGGTPSRPLARVGLPRRTAACAPAFLLVLALAAASCRGGDDDPAKQGQGGATRRSVDWRVSQLFGGATSIEVLSNPQAVEAFRIDPDVPGLSRPTHDPTAPRLGDYRITSGPVDVGPTTTAELTSILLDPDTYDWIRAKGCDFRPGVGLRFVKDASRVEIALCYECDELLVWRMGSRVHMEDFDAARPRLVEIAKRLFPGDPQIQSLK